MYEMKFIKIELPYIGNIFDFNQIHYDFIPLSNFKITNNNFQTEDFQTQDFTVFHGSIARDGPYKYYDKNGKESILYKDWDNLKDLYSRYDYLPIKGTVKEGAHYGKEFGFGFNFEPNEDTHEIEADLVSHSGESSQGEFIFSLNLTDIFSSWVETRAVMGRGQAGVCKALEKASEKLPFKVLGLDSDNGSEFINYHLFHWCEKRSIQFTRSRAYKKDDNAHIEQKNWTHVRKFMGWDRYDSKEALDVMNDLYENELSLFMNLYQPSVKLIKTVRKGSRKKRIYDAPQTPLDRLLCSEYTDKKRLAELKALRESLDPFSLSERINEKLERIWSLAQYRWKPSDDEKKEDVKIEGLSPEEKDMLESIAQVLGITVYIRTRRDGDLIAVRHG